MERLDFGHYTHDAKKKDTTGSHDPLLETPLYSEGNPDETIFQAASKDYLGKWYNHRGFAIHKLAQPDLFDHSKNVDYATALKMPKFNLDGQQILDIATLLMGSVESATLPDSIKYNPDETDQAVREGWWIIKKYNCEGCHQVLPDQVPFLWSLPGWQVKEDENFVNRPPYLVGTGFRTRPNWLAHFLHDPTLDEGAPQSVRDHLTTRMPTFVFTDKEVSTLVRFFAALSNQLPVYQDPLLEPLSDKERAAADRIWEKGPCLQCHVVGDLPPNEETKAPNLDYAKHRLRPEWTARWLRNPSELQPGTEMPALFKKECPHCQKRFSADDMAAHERKSTSGDRDECANCGKDLAAGRWVFLQEDIPAVNAIEGDHIDLMIRYLNDGKFYIPPKSD
jgi:hypothetical protein